MGKERTNSIWSIRIHSSNTCEWLSIQWGSEGLHREPLCTRLSHQGPWWAYLGICLAHPGTDCLFRLSDPHISVLIDFCSALVQWGTCSWFEQGDRLCKWYDELLLEGYWAIPEHHMDISSMLTLPLCVFPSLTLFCLTAFYMWLWTWRKPMADCRTWQRLGDALWLT